MTGASSKSLGSAPGDVSHKPPFMEMLRATAHREGSLKTQGFETSWFWSLDDFSRLGPHRLWDGQPKRLGCLEIDDEVEFGGLLHR